MPVAVETSLQRSKATTALFFHVYHLYVHKGMKAPQPSPSPSVQHCDETVNMDEFVAFSHSFWRFVLSIKPLERSGSQSFHESSVQCLIIQSGFMLEMAMTGHEGREMDAGERLLVYCKPHVVDVLVAQVVLRETQLRGQEA